MLRALIVRYAIGVCEKLPLLLLFASAIFVALSTSSALTSAQPSAAFSARLSLDADGYQVEIASTNWAESMTPANVDPARIHLLLSDARGRVVLGPEHFHPGAPRQTPGDDQQTLRRLAYTYSTDLQIPTPGWYTLALTVDRGAFHRNGRDVTAEPTRSANIYIHDTGANVPRLEPGQRFLTSHAVEEVQATVREKPEATTAATLVDLHGGPILSERIGRHSLVLEHIDSQLSPHVLRFKIDGIGSAQMRTDADVNHLPGLIPLVLDTNVAALDRVYAGQNVWPIGAPSATCASAPPPSTVTSEDVTTAYTIEHVYRGYRLPIHFRQLGFSQFGDDGASEFSVMNPLIVTLHPAGVSEGTSDPGCAGSTSRFADRWDFERAFSRRSLMAAHPNWSAQILAHIRQREVRVGMTHEMIAWTFGYPSVFGTIAELERLATWPYEATGPFGWTVYFRGDAVTRYDPPGQMP